MSTPQSNFSDSSSMEEKVSYVKEGTFREVVHSKEPPSVFNVMDSPVYLRDALSFGMGIHGSAFARVALGPVTHESLGFSESEMEEFVAFCTTMGEILIGLVELHLPEVESDGDADRIGEAVYQARQSIPLPETLPDFHQYVISMYYSKYESLPTVLLDEIEYHQFLHLAVMDMCRELSFSPARNTYLITDHMIMPHLLRLSILSCGGLISFPILGGPIVSIDASIGSSLTGASAVAQWILNLRRMTAACPRFVAETLFLWCGDGNPSLCERDSGFNWIAGGEAITRVAESVMVVSHAIVAQTLRPIHKLTV
jgi:hypothetical protein